MTGSAGYEVDLTGYSVAAVDGDIGHIDKATNELLGASRAAAGRCRRRGCSPPRPSANSTRAG